MPGMLVLMAHGLGSDRSSRGRFPRLATALARLGIASHALRFAGTTIDEQVAELRAAVAAIADRPLALLGHSLGGLVCLRACSSEVSALVLTGAPTGPLHYPEGTVAPEPILRELLALDQAALLARIRCPVLMVVGDGDDEERQLLAQARSALGLLPAGSRLEVIAGAPHGFGDQYDRVIDVITGWLAPFR